MERFGIEHLQPDVVDNFLFLQERRFLVWSFEQFHFKWKPVWEWLRSYIFQGLLSPPGDRYFPLLRDQGMR